MKKRPRRINKLLRELAVEAYERELHRELIKLDKCFDEWRSGEISSGKLSRLIHQYDRGPARELFKTYHDDSVEMPVAYAITVGILERDAVPGEVLQALEVPLSFYQSLKERNRLKSPK